MDYSFKDLKTVAGRAGVSRGSVTGRRSSRGGHEHENAHTAPYATLYSVDGISEKENMSSKHLVKLLRAEVRDGPRLQVVDAVNT